MSTSDQSKIVDSFLNLLSEKDWENITLAEIAEEADMSLSDMRRHVSGKLGLLEAFSQRIDAVVLDEIDKEVATELPRERLMDVLLSRLDALAPYKQAIRALMRAAREDLGLAARLNRIALVSMTWMLNGAGIDTSGLRGAARVQGVSLVFARVLRVWVDDDESMAKTMVKLDKELRAGERNMRRLERFSGLMRPFSRRRDRRRSADDYLNDMDEVQPT